MEGVISVGILCVLGVLLASQLKQSKPEYGLLIGIGICILIFLYGLDELSGIIESFSKFDSYLGKSKQYLGIVLKVTGIAYLCGFCQDLCKDAGFSGVANQIETFGKLSILYLSLPIVMAMLNEIMAFGV